MENNRYKVRSNPRTSSDIIEDMVKEFWKQTYPQDVVVFFYQKYEHEKRWWWQEEIVECWSDSDYETVTYRNDFCEGETCIKDVTIVPLSEVTEFYTKHKLKKEN